MVQIRIDPERPQTYHSFDGEVEVLFPKAVKTNPERFLSVVNQLIAKQRDKAWDHERGGKMFHGAALVRTREGRYFLQANIHLPNSKIVRNCAEANAITEAVGRESIDSEITDVWFMGGRGEFESGIRIVPSDLGKRVAPCGSCLDVIWNQRVRMNGHTRVHMLPLNDGEWKLIPNNGTSFEKLKPNQVLTRTIEELLPNVSLFLSDADGTLKQAVKQAWQYMNDEDSWKSINQAMLSNAIIDLEQSQQLSPEETMRRINSVMLETMRNAWQRSHKELKSAKVAVVRTKDGHYRVGISVDNNKTLGTPGAELQAISQAVSLDPRTVITDVFIMAFDFEKMPALMEQWEKTPAANVELAMPDGDTRDRIFKTRPKGIHAGETVTGLLGDTIDSEQGPNIHIFVPNDGTHFNPEADVKRFSTRSLLPYAFISSKYLPETSQPVRH